MLSANSSDCASDSGLAFPLNDAALARADPDLDLDLVRLVERAALTMDLCGLCGIFRVVLQIRSINPGTQKNSESSDSHRLKPRLSPHVRSRSSRGALLNDLMLARIVWIRSDISRLERIVSRHIDLY